MEVGINDSAIQIKFGSFLNNGVLNQTQLAIMEQIIMYTRINGDINYKDIQNVSPFCDIDIASTFGANFKYLKDLIDGLHKPILEGK